MFARLRLAGFAGGNHGAVIRLLARFNADFGLNGRRLFGTHSFQRRHHRVFVGGGHAGGGLFMALLARLFFPFQTGLTRIKARFGFYRLAGFLIQRLNLGFFLTVILHQRDIARANVRAGAAFDTVKQMVLARLLVLLSPAKPVKLLWQQPGRAGIGAFTATDAGLFFFLRLNLIAGGGQNAVTGLDDRYVQRRQGEPHQRPAHDHHRLSRGDMVAGVAQQMTHWRAQPRPDVARLAQGIAGQGDDPLGQRLAVNDRPFDGVHGADVLHQYADRRRMLAEGHFLAGQDLG